MELFHWRQENLTDFITVSYEVRMSRKDTGNYRDKHPSEIRVDERVIEVVKEKVDEGRISCADVSGIAKRLKLSMEEVGKALDVMEVHLIKCQLGLFGYSPVKMIVKPASSVEGELEKAIRASLVNGRLPCVSAWEIAERFTVSKMDVSSACEALKIKIKPCQLGAF